MSTSLSEEDSGMAGHPTSESSGLESMRPLFSRLSNSSDVQTDITPPTSPTSSEEKMRTPREILDASRRLGQVPDWTPTKPPKQFHHHAPSHSVTSDEAGYDGDGDGDGDGDRIEGSSGTTATRPIRRPAFLRIDTRQHRRVASMLSTRRPTSPGPDYGDLAVPCPQRANLDPMAPLSIRLLRPTATNSTKPGKTESYELRRRPRAEPVGLGIGFPENHPLRSRASTMPVRYSASPTSEFDGTEELKKRKQAKRPDWRTSPGLPTVSRKELTHVRPTGVHAPSLVRLALRPTFLELSPSPIECLPARAGGEVAFCCDDANNRSEVERGYHHSLARKGRPWLNLS